MVCPFSPYLLAVISAYISLDRFLRHLRIVAPSNASRAAPLRSGSMHQDWQSFVRRRLSPGEYFGLHFTLGMLTTVGARALFGSIAEDVVDREQLAIFDLRVAAQIHAHATAAGIEIFRAVTQLGSVLVLAMIAVATAIALFITRHRLLASASLATVAGGALLDIGLKQVFERPRPEGAARYLHVLS